MPHPQPSQRFANLAYVCHAILSGICLAFALAALLVAAFPSQELLLALMGIWLVPAAALACLGALVGTIGAWREWRVVVATLLVAVSVPLGASPVASSYEKVFVFWIVGVFTLNTYFAVRRLRPEWTKAVLVYGAVLLAAGYAVTKLLDQAD